MRPCVRCGRRSALLPARVLADSVRARLSSVSPVSETHPEREHSSDSPTRHGRDSRIPLPPSKLTDFVVLRSCGPRRCGRCHWRRRRAVGGLRPSSARAGGAALVEDVLRLFQR